MQSNIVADNILIFFYYFFSEKIRFGIPHDLSLFELEHYSPVNITDKIMSQSVNLLSLFIVYLTTLFLGRLSPLSG